MKRIGYLVLFMGMHSIAMNQSPSAVDQNKLTTFIQALNKYDKKKLKQWKKIASHENAQFITGCLETEQSSLFPQEYYPEIALKIFCKNKQLTLQERGNLIHKLSIQSMQRIHHSDKNYDILSHLRATVQGLIDDEEYNKRIAIGVQNSNNIKKRTTYIGYALKMAELQNLSHVAAFLKKHNAEKSKVEYDAQIANQNSPIKSVILAPPPLK